MDKCSKLIVSLIFSFLMQNVLASDECANLISQKKFYQAIDICKKMAKEGQASSQFNLGTLYFQGAGVMADERAAYQWIHKAAKNNFAKAQYNIGLMTANGIGSEVNFAQAYAWLLLAKNNGYKDAVAVMEKMGAELSKKEKLQAEKIVKEFKPKTQ